MNWRAQLEKIWRKPAVRAAGLLLVGLLVGRCSVGDDGALPDWPVLDSAKRQQLASCPEQLKLFQRDRRQLQEELAYVKQSVVVEQEACFGLRDALFEKEEAISDLNEQLAFYRRIVAPDAHLGGIHIYRVAVEPAGGRDYQLRLTLLQSVRETRLVSGHVDLTLVGIDAKGGSLRQSLAEGFSGDFEFRYYTEMYGQFRVPEQMTPLRIEVSVTPKGHRKPTATQTYVWKDLTAARGAEESIDD